MPALAALHTSLSDSTPVLRLRVSTVEPDRPHARPGLHLFCPPFRATVMLNKLVVLLLCGGCAALGGGFAELLLRHPTVVSAQPPLPQPPAPIEPEKALMALLSDRFQVVIRQVGPAVVAA